MLEDKDTLLDIADRRWAQALAEAGGTGLGEEAGEHRLGSPTSVPTISACWFMRSDARLATDEVGNRPVVSEV
ncbi:MAG: hypothetical protein J2P17_06305 [Mycobacterium sp.]|nr:hypothetical protein [Mycobacterium sp.]